MTRKPSSPPFADLLRLTPLRPVRARRGSCLKRDANLLLALINSLPRLADPEKIAGGRQPVRTLYVSLPAPRGADGYRCQGCGP